MVEAMAKELGNYNIRVNILALGILEGGASRKLSNEVKEAYLKHCSMKRFGRAEEVAAMASWMALENTYVTGQVVILDGGL
jgi:NAD(P)-dependent dehydrogenase (short-subunit alcohol dehydrogenase family)